MKKYIINIAFIQALCILTISAQDSKRTNIWYFGRNAGIDFNLSPPVPLDDGALNMWEGCATLCDTFGKILIYTDGIKIWNKNHQVMPGANNLGGNNSATQSGIIVPKPNSPNQIYVFSVDNEGQSGGLRYSTVNMNLNGGLGGLLNTNNVLLAESTEKVTVIQHCNKNDYWLIGHQTNTSYFYVWLITNSGISSPIRQSIGSVHGTGPNSIGYLKGSIDGSKIALGIYGQNFFELFDFNDYTGEISNVINLSKSQISNAYGVEFSPNGKLLYLAGSQGSTKIFQFNLSLPSKQAIQNSGILVGQSTSSYFGAIQLAPDGKIYVAKDKSYYLSVINNPNGVGLNCSFAENDFYLGGKESALGLPNLIPSFFSQPVSVSILDTFNVCQGTAKLTGITNVQADSIFYEWYHNNQIIPNQNSNNIIIDSSGEYSFRVYVFKECHPQPFLYTQSIHIDLAVPYYIQNVQATICQGEVYEGYFLEGTYTDIFTAANGCDSIRNLLLTVLPNPKSTIDDSICAGDVYEGYTTSGTYMDVFKGVNGCDSTRTLHLKVNNTKEIIKNITICEGSTYVVNGVNITTEGIYNDTLKTIFGCDSIISFVIIYARNNFLGSDTILCTESECLLESPSEKTSWFDNDITKSKLVTSSGLYWASIFDSDGCKITDSINVQFNIKTFVPNAFSPNDDGINDCFNPFFTTESEIKKYRFTVFDRWGNTIFTTTSIGDCWDGKSKERECSTGVYIYVIEASTEYCGQTIIKGDLTLIK